jgi:ribosomal protection tetracycline resistance protein
MRALQRLRVPTLLFVNKIDRRGAGDDRVLQAIAEKLTPAIVAMGRARDLGTRGAGFTPYGAGDAGFRAGLAETLAEHDDAILAAYVDGETSVPYPRLREQLAAQTGRALAHPVFFGSAITGAGVDALAAGVAELLPAAAGDADGPVSGTVFKIDRGPAGEKVAYVRMFSGTVRTRDRLEAGKVTAIQVFERGSAVPRAAITAGQIGKLSGLADVRIGDAVGGPATTPDEHHFAPPTLETIVVPRRAADRGALHLALTQLAEQDPLIDVRRDDVRQELSVRLYGEVQKEVIQETLATDFGIDAGFRETTTICIERPAGTGAAVEIMHEGANPFLATVGLRIEPAALDSGVEFRLEVELGAMPRAFFNAVEDSVRETLDQGLRGWRVTDCTVTMTHSGYAPRQSHAHQGFDKSMSSTGRDFRHLTPLVLMSALMEAGTTVYEPIHRFHLELPADRLGPLVPALARLRAVPQLPVLRGSSCTLAGDIPAAHVHELRRRLPALTGGEGVLDCAFDRYQPVTGTIPTRQRSHHNPVDREEYLLHMAGRVRH